MQCRWTSSSGLLDVELPRDSLKLMHSVLVDVVLVTLALLSKPPSASFVWTLERLLSSVNTQVSEHCVELAEYLAAVCVGALQELAVAFGFCASELVDSEVERAWCKRARLRDSVLVLRSEALIKIARLETLAVHEDQLECIFSNEISDGFI